MIEASTFPDTPEFSRPVLLAQLGDKPLALSLSATAEECAALARRFDLASLESLTGNIELTRDGQIVSLSGELKSVLEQICVISGDPVSVKMHEAVSLRFTPADPRNIGADEAEEEIELSESDCDILPHDGRVIDAGEALAETMALALDPFPRASGADDAARKAGIKNEDEAGAFGALAELKARMEKDR